MTQTIFDTQLLQANNGSETADRLVINALDGQNLQVPDDAYITNSDIGRDGMDLVLTLDNGSSLTVENYFSVADAPTLVSDSGKALSPTLVESFARDVHGVQYAEAGMSMSDETPIGAINEISGDVTITRTDGSVEKGQLGSVLYQGDVIETNADGAANLVFVDESSLAISEDARLAIDEYVFDPSTLDGSTDFSILQGVFVYTSGIVGREDPDDVTIDTPVGSIGIRGTIIAGDINGTGGESQITVIEGAIVVRNNVSEITLSQQYETVKISSIQQSVGSSHVLEAKQVQDSYVSVSQVAPTVFSSVQDNIQETQQDNNAPDDAKAVDGETSVDSQPETRDQLIREGELKQDGTTLEGAKETLEDQKNMDQQEQDNKDVQEELKTEPETLDGEKRTLLDVDGNSKILADGTSTDGTRVLNITDTTINGKILSLNDAKSDTTAQTTETTATSTEVSPEALAILKTLIGTGGSTPSNVMSLTSGVGVSVLSGFGGLVTGSVITSEGIFTLVDFGTPIQLFQGTAQITSGGGLMYESVTSQTVSIIGDYNNDGNIDIAAYNSYSHWGQFFDNDGGASMANRLNPTGTISPGVLVTSAGDYNGDGYSDFIYSYIEASTSLHAVGLASGQGGTLTDITAPILLQNYGSGTQVISISDVGDMDKDGLDNVAILTRSGAGNTLYVRDGNSNFSLTGLDSFGSGQVSSAGDMNGDGFSDLIVQDGTNTAYIVYGSPSATTLTTANMQGSNGVVINTTGTIYSLDNVGDFNGDGFNDVAITTWNGVDRYRINIIFGDNTALEGQPSYNLADLAGNTSRGFIINHQTAGVLTLSGGADVNGDGMDDLAIMDTASNSVYRVLGRDLNNEGDADLVADSGHDVLRGTNVGETLNAQWHQDAIMIGGGGNDTLIVDTSTYGAAPTFNHLKFDGGEGNDVLRIVGDNDADTLDLRYVSQLNSIGTIDMANGNQDALVLRWDQVLDMAEWTGSAYRLTINGDNSDYVDIDTNSVGNASYSTTSGNYEVWQVGSAGNNVELYIHTNMTGNISATDIA